MRSLILLLSLLVPYTHERICCNPQYVSARLVRTHTWRSSALDNRESHGAHLIGRMKGLLSERGDEQFHQIRSHVPEVSPLLEFQESVAFMPRHFQRIFAQRHG